MPKTVAAIAMARELPMKNIDKKGLSISIVFYPYHPALVCNVEEEPTIADCNYIYDYNASSSPIGVYGSPKKRMVKG